MRIYEGILFMAFLAALKAASTSPRFGQSGVEPDFVSILRINELYYIHKMHTMNEIDPINEDTIKYLQEFPNDENMDAFTNFYFVIRFINSTSIVIQTIVSNIVHVVGKYTTYVTMMQPLFIHAYENSSKLTMAEKKKLKHLISRIENIQPDIKVKETLKKAELLINELVNIKSLCWIKNLGVYDINKKNEMLLKILANARELKTAMFNIYIIHTALETIITKSTFVLNTMKKDTNDIIISPIGCINNSCIICYFAKPCKVILSHKWHTTWYNVFESVVCQLISNVDALVNDSIGKNDINTNLFLSNKNIIIGSYIVPLLGIRYKCFKRGSAYYNAIIDAIISCGMTFKSLNLSEAKIDNTHEMLFLVKKIPISNNYILLWKKVRWALNKLEKDSDKILDTLDIDDKIIYCNLSDEILFFSFVFKRYLGHFNNMFCTWNKEKISLDFKLCSANDYISMCIIKILQIEDSISNEQVANSFLTLQNMCDTILLLEIIIGQLVDELAIFCHDFSPVNELTLE
ncbi:hypothetical protein NEPAR04_1638 [Nematocida parisii]|nr:hypothetical protein NEPAR08_1699 [Nematocida parisii]KAI5129754.1 hypothetical protein NEPAR03_1789 [Nematocida parisii]KAI5142816.1 hypothetical protein NEPAR04_1638 [Nematocida parisii]